MIPHLTLTVGNTWDNEFLDEVILLNKTSPHGIMVTELFGSLPFVTPTARSFDRLPSRDMDFLAKYVQKAHANNITIQWTLNQNCVGAVDQFSWPDLRKRITGLVELGIDHFIISHPLIMELIHNDFSLLHLEVSTIAAIESVEQLSAWHGLGANAVCGKHEINRNFKLLRVLTSAAHKLSMTYKVLATEACLHGPCIWRTSCYLASSHNSHRGPFDSWPFGRCEAARITDPVNWVKSPVILPQWMQTYMDFGVDSFKITGRTLPSSTTLAILKHYVEGEWGGNLLELVPGYSHLVTNPTNPAYPYISCRRLDEVGLLDHFVADGHRCPLRSCSQCRVCQKAYEYAERTVQ